MANRQTKEWHIEDIHKGCSMCHPLALVKLDKAQAEIDSKKGVTGTNVAAAIFWLPGLAYAIMTPEKLRNA